MKKAKKKKSKRKTKIKEREKYCLFSVARIDALNSFCRQFHLIDGTLRMRFHSCVILTLQPRSIDILLCILKIAKTNSLFERNKQKCQTNLIND